jgi:hypothetical protein
VGAGTPDADGLLAQGAAEVAVIGRRVQSGVCSGKPDIIVNDGRFGTRTECAWVGSGTIVPFAASAARCLELWRVPFCLLLKP